MQHARLADNPRRALAAVLAGDAAGIAVQTSGSTGDPREVLIGSDALRASCAATTARLGGPGAWLLAIPAERIGGALVIVRAHLDGTELAELAAGPFTAEAFAAAARAMPPGRRFTSLVPTQVVRLARSEQGRAALAMFDAILVGGAPLPPLGLDANLISTYGATETCGGCVYDGVPLNGVTVATGEDDRVLIGGATLASGYSDGDNASFFTDTDGAWFVTSDVGSWNGQRLVIDGRADDVIITGGLKAHPARVEHALESLPAIAAAAVVGAPDPEWGERVTAWVVPTARALATASGMPKLHEVRAALAPHLQPHELPRELWVIEQLPRTAGGKIDRRALRALARGEE